MASYRRSYVRIKTDIPAKLCQEGVRREDLMVKDVSARGACIIVRKELGIDERIEMHMQLPFSASPVVKTAKVVWKNMLNESLCQAGVDFGLDNMIELPEAFFNPRTEMSGS